MDRFYSLFDAVQARADVEVLDTMVEIWQVQMPVLDGRYHSLWSTLDRLRKSLHRRQHSERQRERMEEGQQLHADFPSGQRLFSMQAEDGPGEHSLEGRPRHDNDHIEISAISVAPTMDEVLCDAAPYLPHNHPNEPHCLQAGSVGRHVDIQFRLLCHDLVAPLWSNALVLLHRLTHESSGGARGASSSRSSGRGEAMGLLRADRESVRGVADAMKGVVGLSSEGMDVYLLREVRVLSIHADRRNGVYFLIDFLEPPMPRGRQTRDRLAAARPQIGVQPCGGNGFSADLLGLIGQGSSGGSGGRTQVVMLEAHGSFFAHAGMVMHIQGAGEFKEKASEGGCSTHSLRPHLPPQDMWSMNGSTAPLCLLSVPNRYNADDRAHATTFCGKECNRIRPLDECPHQHTCPKQCGEPCGPCMVTIRKVTLPCGHQASNVPCFKAQKPSSIFYWRTVKVTMPLCGHEQEVRCGGAATILTNPKRCTARCGGLLSDSCGHACMSLCAHCIVAPAANTDQGMGLQQQQQRLEKKHKECTQSCKRDLPCGHLCPDPCHLDKPCKPCTKMCLVTCQHSSCPQPCHQTFSAYNEPCGWSCRH
ncbi:unnamed protein product [Closterium sp. Naga37s-1]|nr:unnamed protein product [Closterium sp. Naga37s-1]